VSTASGPRSVWHSRDFRLVWGGGFVNDLGDWLLIIALPVYVFTETGSGLSTALLFLVEMAPTVLLGSVAGAFVDRWNLRRTIVVTNLLQAVWLLPLVAVRPDRVWPAFVVAGVQSILTRFNNPAVGALVPRLVGVDQLAAANAANAIATNMSRLAGSPLGGVVVELGGLRAVVVGDGITFVLVAIATSFVRADASPLTVQRGSGDADLTTTSRRAGTREGLQIIRRTRPLPALVAITALLQFAQGLFLVLYIAFVVRELGGTGTEVGLLRGLQAIGGIAGGVAISRAARDVAPGRLIGWGFGGMGLLALGTWNAPSVSRALAVYVVCFIVIGAPAVIGSVGVTTAIQVFAPRAALGRVIGTAEAAGAAGAACGVLAAGALVDVVGVRPMLDVQAGTYLACGVVGLTVIGRRRPPETTSGASFGASSGASSDGSVTDDSDRPLDMKFT